MPTVDERARAIKGLQNAAALERFWAKVDRRGDDECWPWLGSFNAKGYGSIRFTDNKHLATHRLTYILANGKIPKDLEIDHLCRNPACVNPRHLEAVTHAVNMRRSNSPIGINARKTHCKHGHLLGPPKLIAGQPRRQCRQCNTDKGRTYRARKAAANV